MKKFVVHLIKDDRKSLLRRRPQRWRWVAKGANGEVLATGERYTNRTDCLDALFLLFGDETTVQFHSGLPEHVSVLREPRPF